MKGPREIIARLRAPRVDYRPVVTVRISRDAILHNLHAFQARHPGVRFAPVVKSNAYGHGLVEVTKILDSEPKPFFMVDSFYEALVLRRAGVRSKVVMLGYNRMEQLLHPGLKDCVPTIMDFSTLQAVAAKLRRPARFHLKLDTGMHRQGLWGDEIVRAVDIIKANPNIVIEGLCSHLADADGADAACTEGQIAQWNEAAALYRRHFPGIEYFHLGATAGAAYSSRIDANVARLGIGLYGFNVSPSSTSAPLDLRPALSMVSVVSSLRTIPAGERVGYNGTWIAAHDARIATVPVGYREGVDRRLSGSGGDGPEAKGFFMVGGAVCPIVGRVSMNITSVDVTGRDPAVGDEAVVISSNSRDRNSVEHIARACGTIPYEILIHIPDHLQRVVAP